jgi:type II secretion system protein F domain protein
MILVVSLTVSILALIGMFIILIKGTKQKPNSSKILGTNTNLDPSVEKLMKMFGGDITSLVGTERLIQQAKKTKTEELFRKSGNPWKLQIIEFIVLQYVLGCLGVFVGLLFGALLSFIGLSQLGFLLIILLPILGFRYPSSTYHSIAKSKENQYKGQLPEAIDYLILALSGGGYSLPTAFEKVLDFMPNNLIRKEFEQIVNELRSGVTMEQALLNFSDRAPTDGIKAFAKALNNANRLSVSMIDILKARSIESRRDLENEIDQRIATLDSRVTMVFSPVTAVSLGIVVIAPTIWTLSKIL